MRNEHRDIQKWIKRAYGSRWDVEAEVYGQIRLPDAKRHWYQPDVVIRDEKRSIVAIVEVENDPMRKAIVGAAILADASMAELKQAKKPRLLFVVYREEGIKQIPNFLAKVAIAKPYCRHLSAIEVLSESEFKRGGLRRL
jgi:hypothetical protein